ncbi:MAG: J domain-containing protein [Actinomycetota bacterium]|nr:J domain-containing protein [Actinomycetota bacterium]
MSPYEILGVRPGASHREISEAYRVLAQIFHPDRFAGSPKKIQEEAERRMRNLNDAYGSALAGPAAVRDAEARARAAAARDAEAWARATAPPRANSRHSTRPGGPATSTRAAKGSWESAARYRAAEAERYRLAQEAEERSLPTGQAIPKRKTDLTRPSTLLGLGLARETNKLRCRGCNSVQWLPAGWREGLASLDYHCSLCDRRILAR